jgi:diacylglycerol kinase (ATP)
MAVVPTADLADGCLDLAVVGEMPRRELLRHAPRVYRGTHVGHPRFRQSTATTGRIETVDGRAARVQLDGEVVGTTPARFAVVPAALWVAR